MNQSKIVLQIHPDDALLSFFVLVFAIKEHEKDESFQQGEKEIFLKSFSSRYERGSLGRANKSCSCLEKVVHREQ